MMDYGKIGPQITSPHLSDNENKIAGHVRRLVERLYLYIIDFGDAVALVNEGNVARSRYRISMEVDHAEFLQQQETLRRIDGWRSIAARDGAMTAYHFRMTLRAIQTNIGKCPTLIQHLDTLKMKEAHRIANQRLGTIERVRHALAHAADNIKSPEEADKHKSTGVVTSGQHEVEVHAGGLGTNMINSVLFMGGLDKNMHSIDVSEATLQTLIEIESRVLVAFAPIENLLKSYRAENKSV